MPRGEDAKRQSLLRLGDFDLYKKFVDILSLFKRNILIPPLEGEKKFLSELGELSNKGRLGILAQREAGFEPSPFSGEVIDSVISSDFKSKILVNNENILPRKELSALVPQYLSNFSDTVFSRFTFYFSLNRKAAFTLAEVLITLGIIGIVAAMTLPSLITKYKIHELRTRFQKTNSIVNQALKYTLNDLGLSDYSDMNLFNLPNGSQASIYEPVYKEYNQVWEKQFKGAKKLGRQEIMNNMNHKNVSTHPLFTKTFWGEPADWGHLYATSGNLTPTYYLLPDGSLIGQIDAFGTCYASCTIATIFFDTNGPYKGPNRYGYDFFYFDAGIDGQSIFKCGINEANDRTCFYRYALRDQNPFNTSKTYWDNLYKPKSFFEK